MLLRHFVSQGGLPAVTLVQSNMFVSGTSNTATYAIVIKGPKSAVVIFTVTLYSYFPGGANPSMTIGGMPYTLGQTFQTTLDSVTGLSTLTQVLSVTNTVGYVISVQCSITAVSSGSISNVSYQWSNTKNV
jgi:hypothetical protein